MPRDVLRELIANTRTLLSAGYYEDADSGTPGPSLVRALRRHPLFPIIAEVKLASPSHATLSPHGPSELIDAYVRGGAAAFSVLTEPNYFRGSLDNLVLASGTGLPVLMKDFVIDEMQLRAAAGRGASSILLIQGVFSRGLAHGRDELIELARSYGLETVLEAGDLAELEEAQKSEADIMGINQRDLATMNVHAGLAERLLEYYDGDRPAVVMSAIENPAQVRRLRDRGASAVLIGSSLSSAVDPKAALDALAVSR